jgi:hypothetical protein
MKRPWLAGATALLASLSFQVSAAAQVVQPLTVEYDAPAECASSLAFQKLLQAQIARFPEAQRTWRWAVRIHRQHGVYQGTLTSESGVQTTRACRCDDVAAAVALLIAEGEEATPSTEEPLPCAAPRPAPVAAPTSIEPPPAAAAPPPPVDRGVDHPSHPEWRVGARAEFTNHGLDSTVAGGMAVLSLEIPGGFGKLMFEIGGGKLTSTDGASPLSYTVLDTQTCLLDVPLGDTGLSFLGCVRVAGAAFTAAPFYPYGGGAPIPQNGGALWGGVGARIRWQIPFGLFAEASLTGMYGTVSGGESTQPAWYDGALGAGWRF